MERMEDHDAAVVAQVLGGDRDAYRALVERHSRAVFRLAYRMMGNEQDAEDVVQETFLKAYRSLTKFEERSTFSTWLYRITSNCALDLIRKRQRHEQKREPQPVEESELVARLPAIGPTPDRLALSGELGKQISAAMRDLSPIERAAFVLRHHEGHSIEEIGERLGLEPSATKNSIFRAVQKLRNALEPVNFKKMPSPAR
jgi:RNA polymerase sigma-70 factor (ECF subfamily)